MSLLVINTILMVVNISFGIWFVVQAISHILKFPSQRDLRPMVLPIFVTLGYVLFQIAVLLVHTKEPDQRFSSPLQTVWLLIEGGFIYSLNLVVEAHAKPRCYSAKEEVEHDGLATH